MKIHLNNGTYVEMNEEGFWLSSGDVTGAISPEQLVKEILMYKPKDWYKEDIEFEKLKERLVEKDRTIKRLNMEAQRWFDACMDLMYGDKEFKTND